MHIRKFKYMSIILIMILVIGCIQCPTGGSSLLQSGTFRSTDSKQEIAVELSGVVTNNRSLNDYELYSKVVYSYFTEKEDGNYERVEYRSDGTNGIVYVETYAPDYMLIEQKEIKSEAPLWGGFYSGEKYNYLVYGRRNAKESQDSEILRIVKYTKDWKRLGKFALNGMNTRNPFYGGSLRMTEVEGKLYLHTCHEMYQSSDGINHQANMTLCVDMETMSLTQSQCQVTNITQTGYVSHSFNQFIQADGKVIYRVDHGDACPRAITITKGDEEGSFHYPKYTIALPIMGEQGDNYTGVSIGGFELSKESCLIAGNSVAFENVDVCDLAGQRNIFVTITDKELTATEIVWLTDYTDEDKMTPYTPRLVKVSGDRFLVMWEEKNLETQEIHTKKVLIDNKGTVVWEVVRADVALSDCQPIVAKDGFVKWYVSDGQKLVLYAINPDDVTPNPTNVPTVDTTLNPEQNLKKGDVNGDWKVTLADARLALKAALKIKELTATQLAAADVDEEPGVKLRDAQLILKVVLKITDFDSK